VTAGNRVDLARSAAEAALTVLPTSTPLSVGQPGEIPAELPPSQAVCAKFAGAAQGEIVVLVGQDVADALQNSPLGELDLAKAMAPALEAAAQAFGPVVVDPGQAMEPSVALGSLAARGDAVFVPLIADGLTQAGLAIALSPWPGEPGGPQAPAAGTAAPAQMTNLAAGTGTAAAGRARGGLDLLHDVEMEVSAELGRTRMSVRELLSLSPGAVVELDRAAGSPADLLVNGRLIARGEVVVIDENFGIRITEIVSPGSERA
jgi:flagellar motor switch protein FliN/FliY